MQTYPSDTVCTEERGDIGSGLRVRNEGRTIGDVGARWHILRLVVFFFYPFIVTEEPPNLDVTAVPRTLDVKETSGGANLFLWTT